MMPLRVHQQDTPNGYRANWAAAESNKQELAREGIRRRMATGRGSTLTGTLVLTGLVAGAEVALIVAFFKEPELRIVVRWLIFAFGLICGGIMPPLPKSIFPRHRKPEGKEALSRDQCDWDYEDARRSSNQRSQLWRMGVGLAVSLLCTIRALIELYIII